jgi:hypothetical protein
MVRYEASSRARIERGRRRKRTRGKHGESSPRPANAASLTEKEKSIGSLSQALSLEGIKKVAKELRGLVENPEDGIWVSC